MAMTEQYGYGVLPYGDGGYGGYADAYAEMPFVATDEPRIAFRNELALTGANVQITLGSASPNAPLSNAWNGDPLTPAEIYPAVWSRSRTNLGRYSQDLDNAAWAKFACQVTPNAVIAPDGTMTADKVVENTGAASQHCFANNDPNFTFVAGKTYTFSIFAKKGERDKIYLWKPSANWTGKIGGGIDLTSGASYVLHQAIVEAYPDGWYRCSVTSTCTADTNAGNYWFLNGSQTYTGDGISGTYFWGAQIEEGTSASAYIQTGAAPVTVVDYNQALNTFQLVYQPKFSLYRLGYGEGGYGDYGYGGYLASPRTVDCVVFGASRHDAAGARTVPSRYRIVAESGYGAGGYGLGGYGGSVLDRTESPSSSASLMRMFDPVDAVRVTVTLWGLPATAYLPELFLGNSVKLPYLELNYDPYHEVSYGQDFVAESGREYPQLRYSKMELTPRWLYVDQPLFASIDDLRETAFEQRLPVWFNWRPSTSPAETYYVRQQDKSTQFPYITGVHRSLALKLVEAL